MYCKRRTHQEGSKLNQALPSLLQIQQQTTKMVAAKQANSKQENSDSGDDVDNVDSRGGVRFGAGGSYDDTYVPGGGGEGEFVKELPTMEEEHRLMNGGGDVRAREEAEEIDEGRVSYHPSTVAASQKQQVSVCSRNLVQYWER